VGRLRRAGDAQQTSAHKKTPKNRSATSGLCGSAFMSFEQTVLKRFARFKTFFRARAFLLSQYREYTPRTGKCQAETPINELGHRALIGNRFFLAMKIRSGAPRPESAPVARRREEKDGFLDGFLLKCARVFARLRP
jgi:hypothetical protein